jgi:hypothetical protein
LQNLHKKKNFNKFKIEAEFLILPRFCLLHPCGIIRELIILLNADFYDPALHFASILHPAELLASRSVKPHLFKSPLPLSLRIFPTIQLFNTSLGPVQELYSQDDTVKHL